MSPWLSIKVLNYTCLSRLCTTRLVRVLYTKYMHSNQIVFHQHTAFHLPSHHCLARPPLAPLLRYTSLLITASLNLRSHHFFAIHPLSSLPLSTSVRTTPSLHIPSHHCLAQSRLSSLPLSTSQMTHSQFNMAEKRSISTNANLV